MLIAPWNEYHISRSSTVKHHDYNSKIATHPAPPATPRVVHDYTGKCCPTILTQEQWREEEYSTFRTDLSWEVTWNFAFSRLYNWNVSINLRDESTPGDCITLNQAAWLRHFFYDIFIELKWPHVYLTITNNNNNIIKNITAWIQIIIIEKVMEFIWILPFCRPNVWANNGISWRIRHTSWLYGQASRRH